MGLGTSSTTYSEFSIASSNIEYDFILRMLVAGASVVYMNTSYSVSVRLLNYVHTRKIWTDNWTGIRIALLFALMLFFIVYFASFSRLYRMFSCSDLNLISRFIVLAQLDLKKNMYHGPRTWWRKNANVLWIEGAMRPAPVKWRPHNLRKYEEKRNGHPGSDDTKELASNACNFIDRNEQIELVTSSVALQWIRSLPVRFEFHFPYTYRHCIRSHSCRYFTYTIYYSVRRIHGWALRN